MSFEFKEIFYNYFNTKSDKNKLDINLKADLKLKNESEVKNIILKEPIVNQKYCLVSKKNNETNDNKIHMIYNLETNNKPIDDIPKFP